MRLKLFAEEDRKKESDEDTAYQNILAVIKTLENIESSMMSAWTNSASLNEILKSLVISVKKEARRHAYMRHSHTHSIDPLLNKQLKNTRYETQNYKNLEVVTSGFAGILIKILQNHVNGVNLQKNSLKANE